jgi:hypothetical protein
MSTHLRLANLYAAQAEVHDLSVMVVPWRATIKPNTSSEGQNRPGVKRKH